MSKNTDLSELINYVKGIPSGRLSFPFYTSTTSFTGTVAGYLGFDSSGNILTATSPATQWTTSGANIYYNTGNVGINNASPAYKLDVIGDINITGAFRINGTSIGTGGGGGVSGSGTTNYLTKWSGATSLTNSIASDDGSNFMIGSTTSLYKLTVQPSANINFGIGKATLFTTDDSIFINTVNNTYGSVPMVVNAAHIGFYIGFSEALRINSSKNILINTTTGVSGGGILQVNGDVNITGSFKVNGTIIGSGGGGGGNISGSGTSSYIAKFTGSESIGNSAMYDDNNNSIGIGTSSIAFPSGRKGLVVRPNGANSGEIILQNSGNTNGSTAGLAISNILSDGAAIYNRENAHIRFGTNDLERVRILATGELLAGRTTSPYSASGLNQISVYGSSRGAFTMSYGSSGSAGVIWYGSEQIDIYNTSTTGSIKVWANSNGVILGVNGTSWSSASDERTKTDLIPIENGLNKVASLRAITGRYKNDKKGTSRSFLIAQDVQSVLPEAVSVNSEDGNLMLSYTDVIPLLVASIKELKAEIDNLKANIK